MLYILVFTKPKLPVEQPVWATACMLYTRSIYARENDILLHVKRGERKCRQLTSLGDHS